MDYGFRNRMNKALEKAKRVLNNEKQPVFPKDCSHEYGDKFVMVERTVDSAVEATSTSLELIFGLNEEKIEKLKEWKEKGTVTLRFESSEKCKFQKKVIKKEDSGTEHVTKFMGMEKTSKTVYTKTSYLWDFEYNYVISCFGRNNDTEKVVLNQRTGKGILETSTETPPLPENVIKTPKDVDITYFIGLLGKQFEIDRTAESCKTPRRNTQIKKVIDQFTHLSGWMNSIQLYFQNNIFNLNEDQEKLDMSALRSETFIPILPLFEKNEGKILSVADMEKFFRLHRQETETKIAKLIETFPDDQNLDNFISRAEATVCYLCFFMMDMSKALFECIDHVEFLLRDQIIQAIGKEVTPDMIAEYMEFHYRKIYLSDYVPIPFSFDIRRAGYAPEGTLSIETKDDKEISTICRHRSKDNSFPMKFALSAATKVNIEGSQYVHGFISHRFSNRTGAKLKLVGRARQFSSFILMIGNVISKDEFKVEEAIILQNKDKVVLDLILDPLPSAKAFRDAIESLSPEQQRFAKAMRTMQLESTLFAISVVQIKPQLELLLGLPQGSLTKEIKLTQDLMKLFIDFQIPADMMSFDGDESLPTNEKIQVVKKYTADVMEIIDKSKTEGLEEERKKAENQIYQSVQQVGRQRRIEMDFMASSPTHGSKPLSVGGGGGGGQRSYDRMAMAAPAMAAAPPRQQQQNSMPLRKSAASPPAPPPPVPQKVQEQVEKPKQPKQPEGENIDSSMEIDIDDYTKIPSTLDKRFEILDTDSSLRPTTISLSKNSWKKTFYKNLLSKEQILQVDQDEKKSSKSKSMDLIDAITKSGEIPLIETEFHVVIASTHCFDKDVMSTLIQDNVNPIEKIERSSVIVASTIHDKSPQDLLAPAQKKRVLEYSPNLLY